MAHYKNNYLLNLHDFKIGGTVTIKYKLIV